MVKRNSLVLLIVAMLSAALVAAQQTPDENMMSMAQTQDMMQTCNQMKSQMQNMMSSCQQMMGDMMPMMQMRGLPGMVQGGKMEMQDIVGGSMMGGWMTPFGGWNFGSVLWIIITIGLAVLIWLWIMKLWRDLFGKR